LQFSIVFDRQLLSHYCYISKTWLKPVRAVHSGGGATAPPPPPEKTSYIYDFYNVISNYSLDILDFFRHIGLTTYGPGTSSIPDYLVCPSFSIIRKDGVGDYQ
jgi:hypothetical protein